MRNPLLQELQTEVERGAGIDGNGQPLEKQVDIDARLAGLWFDPQKPPPAEPVLITIAGVSCATPGNITTLTAQKKSGKTAFLSAIMAAGLSGHGDTLGVRAFNPENKLVLHFDTEQSPMDHWRIGDSILRRAQLTESAIFKSVCLTSLSIRERQAAVFHVIRQEARRTGVFIAVIDGHGDLVRNVNDPEESADYVAAIHTLAIETRCHIFGALHLNPGSTFKSRGHLGSELERKSQTNLQLEKADGVFRAWGDANRGAPIPRAVGPCFAWSDQKRMHVSVESGASAKGEAGRGRLADLAESAFGKHPSMQRNDLESTVKKRLKVSESTAYRKVAEMIRAGVIKKSVAGLYVIACPAESK